MPLYRETAARNAYIDAFLTNSDIFCINTRSTQGCSEDYFQCTANDKTIFTHAGCKSSKELVKRIFYLLFEPSVRVHSPLELRKGVALNGESLNTRHDEHSTRSRVYSFGDGTHLRADAPHGETGEAGTER